MQVTQPASLRHCVACGFKLAGLLLCMLGYVAMETILHAQDQFDAMEKTIYVWALAFLTPHICCTPSVIIQLHAPGMPFLLYLSLGICLQAKAPALR